MRKFPSVPNESSATSEDAAEAGVTAIAEELFELVRAMDEDGFKKKISETPLPTLTLIAKAMGRSRTNFSDHEVARIRIGAGLRAERDGRTLQAKGERSRVVRGNLSAGAVVAAVLGGASWEEADVLTETRLGGERLSARVLQELLEERLPGADLAELLWGENSAQALLTKRKDAALLDLAAGKTTSVDVAALPFVAGFRIGAARALERSGAVTIGDAGRLSDEFLREIGASARAVATLRDFLSETENATETRRSDRRESPNATISLEPDDGERDERRDQP
jgi:hypothetical protein